MTGYDVVVVGGIGVDVSLLVTEPLRPGRDVPAREEWTGPGGKGAMTAVCAARQGGRVALVGRVGADAAGDEVLDGLAGAGVDTRYVSRDEDTPTGRVFMVVRRGDESLRVVRRGANAQLRPEHVLAAAAALASAGMVAAQLEVPQPAVQAAFEHAKSAGVPRLLDPAPVQPVAPDLLALATVVRANADEAERLTGVSPDGWDGARHAAGLARRRGPSTVVFQAGAEGDLAVWHEDELRLPRRKMPVVDPTGAGDAFTGTFALELSRRAPHRRAARRAAAASALATTALGALPSLPTAREIDALLSSDP
ncbi:PfkB family carbohydrate kinase [Actinocorallia populi]|uniref:PfkB family carbohydrate kinase n=1 Tax=Actinocorallia populi TaxID=2079200 RepID=UPI00130041FF|nr:PfkB family carbohydrate kinase [Actinocorallia populi]